MSDVRQIRAPSRRGGHRLVFLVLQALRKSGAVLFALGLFAALNSPLSAQPNNGSGLISSSSYLWSIPEVRILDVAPAANGTAVLVLQDREKRLSLLIGASALGAGSRVPFQSAKALDPYAIHSAVSADGSIWIGGRTNNRRSSASAPLSDAYVAKLDPDGHLVWEVAIARKRENAIFDVAILSSGGAVIVGREDDANWLARMSGDGDILWEKTFGLGEIASVAVLNDLIAVMAFEAVEGGAKGASARVALWRFDSEGSLLDHHVVRDDAAQKPGAPWLMKAGVGRGDIFAASAWTEPMLQPSSARALSVTRLTAQGQIVWQRNVPETIVQRRMGPMPCPPSALIPQGGGLVTFCVAAEGTVFFHLEPATGTVVRELLPNSTAGVCGESSGRASFMLPHSDSSIWIFGTGGSCSWLQQVQFTQ